MATVGERNAITDVEGIRVGHHERLDGNWATGTSVVLVPDGAVAAVDVRGGGPGTRETDALDPTHLAQRAHAIVLSGGSAYGLASADGVMRWLGERGHGLPVGSRPGEVVPIVPAAAVFDLPMSDWGNRPDAQFGYRACEAAATTEAREGNVGAGAGAVSGYVKGGVGTASAVLDDGTTVGALMVVNSAGSVIDPDTGLPWPPNEYGLRAPAADEIAAARERVGRRPSRDGPVDSPLNTTIGVVAADVGMTKSDCLRVAVAAQDGLARAVRPAHGMFDGDTIFALATGAGGRDLPRPGTVEWGQELDVIGATAARVVETAIVRAVLAAEALAEVMSYTRIYPSAVE